MLPANPLNLNVQKNFTFPSKPKEIDTKAAKEALLLATGRPEESHIAVGILRPDESTMEMNLGKDENYGAHRVGSVTKTFTAFLALKLIDKNVITLKTKCGDLIDENTRKAVFQNPDFAKEMTLEELLSHTAGLEQDDHNRQKPEPGLTNITTMQDRFIYESKTRKYIHTHRPGDGLGSYSNAGLAVAAWMMEKAYAKSDYAKSKKIEEPIPFSQIMKKEIFEEVFQLSEDTCISPGPSGDVIGSGAGDMTSSIPDLLKVAKKMQQGQDALTEHFGQGWQKTMLEPRDIFKQDGLGCKADATSIQHFGLNAEIIDGNFQDVTAVVIFPLGKEEPALVAMSDSNALGPSPAQQNFVKELQKLAAVPIEEQAKKPVYEPDFFCPTSETLCVFRGDAYIVTDVDPFSYPDKINLSRNGMKHQLQRNASFDAKDAIGYEDTNGKKWLMVSKGEEGERKIIYSDYCLVSPSPETRHLQQPPLEKLKAIQGEYYDVPDKETYNFKERGGNLYFCSEGVEYPALYLPEENFWVVSLPEGRKNIKIRFPEDPTEPLIVVDISKIIKDPESPILKDDRLRPLECFKI
jgi:CubicO group peptidase (beta-lactamase class C family)